MAENDLMADTTRRKGRASILRDDLRSTDQATGYDSDASADYIL